MNTAKIKSIFFGLLIGFVVLPINQVQPKKTKNRTIPSNYIR